MRFSKTLVIAAIIAITLAPIAAACERCHWDWDAQGRQIYYCSSGWSTGYQSCDVGMPPPGGGYGPTFPSSCSTSSGGFDCGCGGQAGPCPIEPMNYDGPRINRTVTQLAKLLPEDAMEDLMSRIDAEVRNVTDPALRAGITMRAFEHELYRVEQEIEFTRSAVARVEYHRKPNKDPLALLQ